MDQNTEAWLKFRGNSIGASEMAVIMGVSPYKKRNVLLREKAFPFPKDEDKAAKSDKNFIFQKGHNYEIKIRNFIEFDCDLSFPHQPTVIFSHPEYTTPIHASLDGITESKEIILEAKYVGFDAFEEYKKTKTKDGVGIPPIHYMWQIQQQLLITGAKKCIFAFCREHKNDKGIELQYDYFDVLPDNSMMELILVEAKKFWDEVLEMRASGPKDYSELDNLIESYRSNVHAMDLLNVSQNVIKEKIFAIAGTDKIERSDYSVQTVVSKGSVKKDYEGFVTEAGLVLPEKFISVGKGSTSQRITFKKPSEKKDV